ncbi:GGDEF domain-containing protein [Trinickia dinghuensis]|uniref:diguanylate cyclase n=1 Tax=Trinickia dinghuensis TaxID=2291023 RepID=A0A3D8JTQ6_9BURK|nr:GGDEF domain-containing protein [Trinickia dinghuensis]RDU95781.1 sensor domain-containing diguanylate cyclase [Trinickia dinghuensis]
MKRSLIEFAKVAVTFGAFACLGIALTHATWGVSSIWPANGLIVGLFFNGRKTRWRTLTIAVAAGALVANLLFLRDRPAVPLFTFGNVVEVLALWVSLSASRAPVSAVVSPRSLFRFLLCAVLFPATVSALAVGVVAHLTRGWPLLFVSRSWLFSDALGLALFLPLGHAVRGAQRLLNIGLSRRRFGTHFSRASVHGVLAHAIVLLVSVATFHRGHWIPPYWVLPSVILAVLWAGSYAAVTGTCIASAVAVISTVSQPFSSPLGAFATPEKAILEVQGFTLACMLASYLMASVLADRRRYLAQATAGHRTQLELARKLREANAELEALALQDPLTRLPNRRRFESAFADGSFTTNADRGEVAVMFIDVDWFKRFNDRYGHAFGDGALRAVANVIGERLPDGAIAARIGGEEFAVLMPDASAAVAEGLAESIVQRVRLLSIAHADSPYEHVTVSVGLMLSKRGVAVDRASLLDAADAAMYRAKSEGRNRWVRLDRDGATHVPAIGQGTCQSV